MTCTQCTSAVLVLPGVKLDTANLGYPSLDPIDWLAAGERMPETCAYACKCQRTSTSAPVEVAAFDTRNIDSWFASTAVDLQPERPALLGWREAIRGRIVPGAWFVLDDAYEVLPGGSLRVHPWSATAPHELPADTAAALIGALGEPAIHWLARQFAPSQPNQRLRFAVLGESWVHGDLDAVFMTGSYADVPALLAGLRHHREKHKVVPGLLHARGYLPIYDYA